MAALKRDKLTISELVKTINTDSTMIISQRSNPEKDWTKRSSIRCQRVS